MTKQRFVPNVALMLVCLGSLVFLYSLVPSNLDGRREADFNAAGPEGAQAGTAEPQAKERKVVWGETVQGLRLGIICDFDQLLPGQDFGLGLCVENVSGEPIKVEQFCSVGVRAQRRHADVLEDMAPTVEKDDPLFNFALVFQDELKPGARVAISCGFCYQITKGFLRVGNSRYGPFLAGQFTLVGQATLTPRSEPGAKGEKILLTPGATSFTVRDIEWGPAHDGVQIALVQFGYGSPDPDSPVFALVCRNSSDKHIQLATGFAIIQDVAVNKPNGKTEWLGPISGEGSFGFDLKPGEIQLHPHDFRWHYVNEPTRGEYAFWVDTSFHSNGKVSPLYTTNRLRLKLPE